MRNYLLCAAAILLQIQAASAQTNRTDRVHNRYAKQVRKVERRLQQNAKVTVPDSSEAAEEETPDQYWIQQYLATMDPALKRPTPEVLLSVLQAQNAKQVAARAMPGTSVTAWVERGPYDVGGRTRALAWDPSDATGKKVWAGGVSGGLWYISDITSTSAVWQPVSSIWANLAVTAIAFDPNAPGTMYVGTGEGFGSSSSLTRGFGIWKSVDSGRTFTQLSSTTNFYYCTDIVVRDESGSSVVYASINTNYYGGTFHGTGSYGMMRSTNGGSAWTNVSSNAANSAKYNFADIEIGADNRLWAGTMANYVGGSDRGGGRVMYSDNGTTWNTAFTNDDKSGRVEVACAPSNANVIYALFESGGVLDSVIVTHNKGVSWSPKGEPDDADNGITAKDFTRGQAWYDLVAAVDPNDTNTLIIGGVDLFRSTNGASSWTQISKWSNNPNLNTLSCPYVHADQHAIVFKAGSSSTVIFGNDGGVFYTSAIASAASTSTAINARNKGYNVTQFYWGDQAAASGSNLMLAGAQDNGTQKFTTAGVNTTTTVSTGDGAYCFISASNSNKQIASYVYNQFYYTTNNWTASNTLINDGSTGKFINPAEWDDFGGGLFTCRTNLTGYRIKLGASPGTLDTFKYASTGADRISAMFSHKNGSTTNLWVGTDAGRIFLSTDAWATTASFTSKTGPVNAGNISGFYALGKGDTVAVVLSNYGIKNIYLSLDAGKTWKAKDTAGATTPLPNMPVWSIVINPNNPNEAVVATETGVYGTTNFLAGLPNWSAYNLGMGSVKVSSLRYRNSDRVLMASTHGRGVFTSDAWAKTSPIANFGASPKAVCTNANVQFTDSTLNNPTQWAWTFLPKTVVYMGGTDSTSQNPIVRFTKGGTYTCSLKATNTIGNNTIVKPTYITVTDTVATTAFLTGSRDSLCAGDTFTLSASVLPILSGTITNYAWFKNKTAISGSASSIVVNPALKDTFYVQLTSNKLCASPAVFKSNVLAPKAIAVINASIKLNAPNGCSGKPLTITATGNKLGSSPSFSWYLNNLAQAGNTNQFSIPLPMNGDKVWTTVNVPGFCVKPANQIYSDTAILVVNTTPTAPAVSRNFDTLFASNVGSGGYLWYRNGALSGSGRVYRAPQNGTYKCVYTENGCSSDSSTAIIFNSLGLLNLSKASVLYPNPASEFVMVPVARETTARLYSADGKLVHVYLLKNTMEGYSRLDLSFATAGNTYVLTSGVYYLVLGNENSEQVYKIDKQ